MAEIVELTAVASVGAAAGTVGLPTATIVDLGLLPGEQVALAPANERCEVRLAWVAADPARVAGAACLVSPDDLARLGAEHGAWLHIRCARVPGPSLTSVVWAWPDDDAVRPSECVVLVFDTSGSMVGAPLQEAKAAAAAFLDVKLSQRPTDEIGLVTFGPEARVRVAPTSAGAGWPDTLADLVAGGGTPLFEALALAVTLLARSPLGRRRLVVLTDGHPDAVDESVVARTLGACAQNGIGIVALGVGTGHDRLLLQRLALATPGGRYLSATRLWDLAASLEGLA